MTRPLPFTKASIRRAIAAAESAGYGVRGIGPDGSVQVEKRPAGLSGAAAASQDSDPFVQAVLDRQRGNDAKAQGKRRGGSA